VSALARQNRTFNHGRGLAIAVDARDRCDEVAGGPPITVAFSRLFTSLKGGMLQWKSAERM
jgi:hypothetical protein